MAKLLEIGASTVPEWGFCFPIEAAMAQFNPEPEVWSIWMPTCFESLPFTAKPSLFAWIINADVVSLNPIWLFCAYERFERLSLLFSALIWLERVCLAESSIKGLSLIAIAISWAETLPKKAVMMPDLLLIKLATAREASEVSEEFLKIYDVSSFLNLC